MSEPMEQREFQERTQEIERLVERVQALEDENARTVALDLWRMRMGLHGAVLARVVELAVDGGEVGRALLATLCSDRMVSGLLVLYGLHPLELETRVAGAIEKVREDLQSRGGSAELLGIADAAVRVRIQVDGHGCGSSAEVVKSLVEQAIYEAAPEVLSIEVEGAAASAGGFVPLAALQPNAKENSYEKPAA
jgi:Fe-S cluster biogenesis protein NfuA